ncbi:MAG TPA: aa3-type cytochrome c oxidase subunit IV [Caulobacteraceae bacterium]|jgi:hypothetical protein|nr:aa3-type cytochrome c oxidase subunit IV [Caulobacteraceae bacterium]
MAEPASDYHRGEMDIHAQRSTFESVMTASKWATLAVIAGVAFLTLWFCTAAGFGSALVTAIIIVALGVFFLRERPAAH